MITGTHAIIYANDAERARAFFRDVLELPNVDAHGGWLIFKLPPAELGIHPAGTYGDPVAEEPSGLHELYLMCDDVEATVAELAAKGVEFTALIEDQGFGLLTRLPGSRRGRDRPISAEASRCVRSRRLRGLTGAGRMSGGHGRTTAIGRGRVGWPSVLVSRTLYHRKLSLAPQGG